MWESKPGSRDADKEEGAIEEAVQQEEMEESFRVDSFRKKNINAIISNVLLI